LKFSEIAKAFIKPVLIASLLNAVAFFIAVAISGDIVTTNSPMTITVFHVIGFTIFQGGILGAIFAWFMLKTSSPSKNWKIYATLLLVVSFILPFGGVQTTTMALWLNLLHVIAAIVIIPAIAKSLPVSK
jgi:hypothetical protein